MGAGWPLAQSAVQTPSPRSHHTFNTVRSLLFSETAHKKIQHVLVSEVPEVTAAPGQLLVPQRTQPASRYPGCPF